MTLPPQFLDLFEETDLDDEGGWKETFDDEGGWDD